MGGYGFYVWSSYAVAVVVIGAEIWALRQRRRAALAQVRRPGPAAGRPE
jgi:heme exporter protein D